MTIQEAFINGFIKAANASMIPSTGAQNLARQPNFPGATGQSQGAQLQPEQRPSPLPQQQQPNQLFYKLLAQLKQQNPMPQVPQPIQHSALQPPVM